MNTDGRLERLLGGPELAKLRERLRGRFEGGDVVGSIRLGGLTPVERSALAQLAGKPSKAATSIVLDVGELDRSLRSACLADSLRAALERLDGPIVDRVLERERSREAWARLVADCDHVALQTWLTSPLNLGLLKRLSANRTDRASDVIARAIAVLRRLPCDGIPRAQLAAEVLGDAHGLDSGRPVATVVLSVLRVGRVDDETDEEGVDGSHRSLWAAAGVLVNELARPVLCLNVPVADGDGGGTKHGRPTFMSLRELLRHPPTWQVDGQTVYVCENPNVVAIAADRLGAACAPLVCTDGMPAAAQKVLLRQLLKAGAELAYHGDFDWPGMRIADLVIRRLSARPWRMEVADYRAAVAQPDEQAPLSARPEVDFWNQELAAAMATSGVAVPEEAVVASLLADLSRGGNCA